MSTRKKITVSDFLQDDSSISIQITGSNSYYENIIRKEISTTFKDMDQSGNVHFFDLSKTKDISEILNAFNTYPCFSKFRYVVVKGITKSDKDSIIKIIDYLQNPSKTTKHIFLSNDNNVEIPCESFIKDDHNKANARKFINEELKKRNMKLNDEVIEELSAKNFNNKSTLINEIEKIESFLTTNDDKEIIKDMVDGIKRESFDETYNLMHCINRKDLKSCLLELKKTKFTENIFLEMSKIAWRFRIYLKIKTFKKNNMKESEIITNINVSKYQYKHLDIESENKTFKDILEGLRALKNTDRLLKSTDISHDLLAFYLLKKLCGQ